MIRRVRSASRLLSDNGLSAEDKEYLSSMLKDLKKARAVRMMVLPKMIISSHIAIVCILSLADLISRSQFSVIDIALGIFLAGFMTIMTICFYGINNYSSSVVHTPIFEKGLNSVAPFAARRKMDIPSIINDLRTLNTEWYVSDEFKNMIRRIDADNMKLDIGNITDVQLLKLIRLCNTVETLEKAAPTRPDDEDVVNRMQTELNDLASDFVSSIDRNIREANSARKRKKAEENGMKKRNAIKSKKAALDLLQSLQSKDVSADDSVDIRSLVATREKLDEQIRIIANARSEGDSISPSSSAVK